ncbi:glycoside hydrolase [Rhodobacteraceae bacterium RKSG542]|uniref:C40 family peptidase n=1 Tax=Pseudovibrio flavus TaxID=2529854 RepID=UPI0012BC4CFC|nr:NlpC/P60 family protein [Pseudovibrio flavus]MTI17168.1 glycoside hydrolase [Pseudovibrio flavus]
MTETFDRRLHPVRPELAADEYRGRFEASSYVEGTLKSLVTDKEPLRAKPSLDSGIDTEVLYGETLRVFEETSDGRSWAQSLTDSYVGWLPSSSLGTAINATHRVLALRTYRYPEAELKRPPVGMLSMGSMVQVVDQAETRGLEYSKLSDGSWVVSRHLVGLDHKVEDWVSVAESMVGTPYLWGGRSTVGTDCSGLVQLSAQTGGFSLPRDADMQEAGAGTAIPFDIENLALQRGDLLFWRGHVGIMSDPDTLLHANGFTMSVAYEPLRDALARIAKNEFGELTSVRRLVSA